MRKISHCALWATLSLAVFVPAVSAGSEGMPAEAELQSSMRDLTETFNRIRDARDSIVSAPVRMTRDVHGRTLSDDMRQNVLVPSVRENLESLLRAAADSLNAHDLPAASSLLREASAGLRREDDTYQAITAYWKLRGSQRPNRGPYLTHLRMNGLEPRYVDEIEAAETSFEQQIEAGLFAQAMNVTLPLIRRLYERAAEEEAVQIHAAMKRGDFVPFRTQEGDAKCSRATRKTSASPRPKMLSRLSMDDYYPPATRRPGEDGYVIVDVLIARNGCPARAFVTVSSGYEHLDAAALSYALHASYRPAEIDGRAANARMSFPLKFESVE